MLVKSATRLLRTAEVRWDNDEQAQQVGSVIDLALEQRIARVAQMAAVFQLAPLRALFETEMHALIARYRQGGFDMSNARMLVQLLDRTRELK